MLRLALSAAVAVAALAGGSTLMADAPPQRVASAPGAAGGQGTVRGDRSNVRSRPSINAEVLAQLNRGARIEILERQQVTEGNRTMEWFRIPLPANATCFVNAKFVENGVATGDAVNVRCGPGTTFREVGKLAKGERVEVVKTAGEWLQIKPTARCTGWIAAELVDVEMEAAEVPPPVIVVPEVVTAPVAVPPAPAPAMPAIAPVFDESEVQVQYVVKHGVLRAVTDVATAPGSYELLTPEANRMQHRIAYLEAATMNLSRYEGKNIRVLGNQHWRRGERYPVIIVERVDMIW